MGNTSAGAATVLEGNYLSKAETAEKLHKQPKTIEAMGQDGRLKTARVPHPGRKPEVVYLQDDVERLAREEAERKARRRDKSVAVAAAPKTLALSLPPEIMQMLVAVTQKLLEPPAPPQRPDEKLWLTLEEAIEYSGLGVTFLKGCFILDPELYQAGRNIVAVKGGPKGVWMIRRDSLEALEG